MKFHYPPYPTRDWFYLDKITAVVINASEVRIEEFSATVKLKEGQMPATGTKVILHPKKYDVSAEAESDYIVRITQEKLEQEEKLKLLREREDRESFERSKRLMGEALATNATLNVPVRWTSGFKSVLSGLSEHSSGNGRKKNTVIHVLLLDGLDDGSLKRKKGDFLCSASSGLNGKLWVDPATFSSGACGKWVSEVTCKQCLKVAKRWEKQHRENLSTLDE